MIYFSLDTDKDLLHSLIGSWALLNTLHALPGILQRIRYCFTQEIFFSHCPETEHIINDVTPESQTLQSEIILSFVTVRQTSSILAAYNGQGVTLFYFIRREMGFEKINDLVDRNPVRIQK